MGPDLVAELAEQETLQDLQMRVLRLARLALLSRRVPVWPTINCTAKLISGKYPSQTTWPDAPFEMPIGWLPYFHPHWKQVGWHRTTEGLG